MRRAPIIGIVSVVAWSLAPRLAPASPAPLSPHRAQSLDANQQQEANRHHRLGWQHLAIEEWENAREEFLKAIRIVKVFPNAYYGLGKAHLALRAYEKAVEAFSTCREQYTMLAGSEFTEQLAARQRRQDEIQEIRSIIREMQSSRANQSRAAQGMPQSQQVRDLQEYLRQIEDAERSGRSLAPELSVPAEVYLSLGSALFRSNKLREAEVEYLNAVKAKPDFGAAHNNLAVIYLETGRLAEAERSVAAAEKAGFKVHPQLKQDIKDRKRGGSL